MDIIAILGVVGSIASIPALFLPASRLRERVIHSVYVLIIVCIAGGMVHYRSHVERMRSVSRGAEALIENRERHYTYGGFSQAALTFLEQNRDLYPDSYRRAQSLCERHDCIGTGSTTNEVTLAFALEGQLRGIAAINRAEKKQQASQRSLVTLAAILLSFCGGLLMIPASWETPWSIRTWGGKSANEVSDAKRGRNLLIAALILVVAGLAVQLWQWWIGSSLP